MTDVAGWQAVGEFEDATRPDNEEADKFSQRVLEDAVDDQRRTVDVHGDGDAYLEQRAEDGDRWVPVVEVTAYDPNMYASDVLADLVEDTRYRAVAVHGEGAFIEKRVTEDD